MKASFGLASQASCVCYCHVLCLEAARLVMWNRDAWPYLHKMSIDMSDACAMQLCMYTACYVEAAHRCRSGLMLVHTQGFD